MLYKINIKDSAENERVDYYLHMVRLGDELIFFFYT